MDVRTYRRRHHLTQRQFADLLVAAGYPTTQSLVSQWENGIVRISPERATQIDTVTGGEVSRAYLVFGEAA